MSESKQRRPDTRLDELMIRAGVSNANLGRLTGVTRAWIHKMRHGGRTLSVDWAKRAAPWLSCDWTDLLDPIGKPVGARRPLTTRAEIARRVRAVRIAWWEDLDSASRGLGVSVDILAEIEAGTRQMDEAFLIRFCETCRVPADFVIRGIQEPRPLEPAIRNRIAQHDPDLVPLLPPLSLTQAEAA